MPSISQSRRNLCKDSGGQNVMIHVAGKDRRASAELSHWALAVVAASETSWKTGAIALRLIEVARFRGVGDSSLLFFAVRLFTI